MTTPHSDDKDLGDQFADAAAPDGSMTLGREGDPDRGGMTEALEENAQDLARGENPLSQGPDGAERGDSDRDGDQDGADGAAGVFSPGRSDQPE